MFTCAQVPGIPRQTLSMDTLSSFASALHRAVSYCTEQGTPNRRKRRERRKIMQSLRSRKRNKCLTSTTSPKIIDNTTCMISGKSRNSRKSLQAGATKSRKSTSQGRSSVMRFRVFVFACCFGCSCCCCVSWVSWVSCFFAFPKFLAAHVLSQLIKGFWPRLPTPWEA